MQLVHIVSPPLGGNSRAERMPQIVFSVLLLIVFGYGVASSYPLSFLGAVFPTATSALMLCCLALHVLGPRLRRTATA